MEDSVLLSATVTTSPNRLAGQQDRNLFVMAKAIKTVLTARSLAKPTRLDRLLRDQFPLWGRQAVKRLIAAGKVQLNGRVIWLASWEVQNGDRLEIVVAVGGG